ncbi:hypothetical protein ABEF95_002391 [Exophiala dermatitidis]
MPTTTSIYALLVSFLTYCAVSFAQTSTATANAATYTNPILNSVGADPWVIRHEGYYYMTYTTNDNITILRSSVLTDWNNAHVKLAFLPPTNTSYSYDLWAPELHFINGLWYIIFTADVDADSPPPDEDMLCDFSCPAVNHRMFVLESSTSDPWTSTYAMKAELNTFDQFAIDGTYFILPLNSTTAGDAAPITPSTSSSSLPFQIYHIYSCWESTYTSWPSMLCIARMSDPWTVSSSLSERAVISRPDQPWEKTPYNRTINDRLSSNEGPEQLTNPTTGQQFVIYSAARSDNRNYCLGRLELVANKDPMDPGSWIKNTAGCVFWENPEQEVYGVGHASFTTSPDGSEDWIVYHGMKDYENGWSARTIRAQRFTWDESTGVPLFPRPGVGPFEVPSGKGGNGNETGGSGSGAGAGSATTHTATGSGSGGGSPTGSWSTSASGTGIGTVSVAQSATATVTTSTNSYPNWSPSPGSSSTVQAGSNSGYQPETETQSSTPASTAPSIRTETVPPSVQTVSASAFASPATSVEPYASWKNSISQNGWQSRTRLGGAAGSTWG